MDDRRFDSLVKSFASGASRRSVLKGILGLGGAALGGGTLLESGVDAARSTPTPKPVSCPGRQTWTGTQCKCPTGLSECGPDCCNPTGIPDTPNYSECCDNACCYGHCYGEELCCEYPLVFCAAQNECCGPSDNQCCGSMGCCDHECCQVAGGAGACCEGETPKCCGGDACIPADGCCTDADCGSGCQSCIDHVCTDDRSKCAGGTSGCNDCQDGHCVANNTRCDNGLACDDDLCDVNSGQCSHPFNCHGMNSCCDDGDPCTANVCDGSTCSYPANCNGMDSCCPAGQRCGSNGACYTPCLSERLDDCSDTPCCSDSGLTCIELPVGPDLCLDCIPTTFEDVPVPCLGFCDLCCSGKSFGPVCVNCYPVGDCDHDSDCCSGNCVNLGLTKQCSPI